MEHTTRDGQPKIFEEVYLAAYGREGSPYNRDEMAYLEVTPTGLVLEEIAPGITVDEVAAGDRANPDSESDA